VIPSGRECKNTESDAALGVWAVVCSKEKLLVEILRGASLRELSARGQIDGDEWPIDYHKG
jgi:hypothetical protein